MVRDVGGPAVHRHLLRLHACMGTIKEGRAGKGRGVTPHPGPARRARFLGPKGGRRPTRRTRHQGRASRGMRSLAVLAASRPSLDPPLCSRIAECECVHTLIYLHCPRPSTGPPGSTRFLIYSSERCRLITMLSAPSRSLSIGCSDPLSPSGPPEALTRYPSDTCARGLVHTVEVLKPPEAMNSAAGT